MTQWSEETLFGHPKGLFVLFLTEMWERFSYYGMRALLVYYMIKQLMFTQGEASQIYGLYTGLVYLTPLFGGILADRVSGSTQDGDSRRRVDGNRPFLDGVPIRVLPCPLVLDSRQWRFQAEHLDTGR